MVGIGINQINMMNIVFRSFSSPLCLIILKFLFKFFYGIQNLSYDFFKHAVLRLQYFVKVINNFSTSQAFFPFDYGVFCILRYF